MNASDRIEVPNRGDTDGIELPPVYEPGQPKFDLTKDKSDACPVHKVKMTAKIVRVLFSFDTRWVSEFEKRKAAEFPFAYAFIYDSYVSLADHPDLGMRFFCGTGLPPETFAKMFVCPQCLAAYESTVRAFNAKVVAAFDAQRAEEAKRVAPKQH